MKFNHSPTVIRYGSTLPVKRSGVLQEGGAEIFCACMASDTFVHPAAYCRCLWSRLRSSLMAVIRALADEQARHAT